MAFTTESFKELWNNLWNWRQTIRDDALNERNIEFGEIDLMNKPTQSNKPSPHSSLTLFEAKNLFAKMFPAPKYWVTFVSNTNSMEPWIDDNTIVALERLDSSVLIKQPLTVGDIVVWYRSSNNTYIIHRIMEVDKHKDRYYIKGDNNFLADGWIPISDIRFRLVSMIYTRQIRDND